MHISRSLLSKFFPILPAVKNKFVSRFIYLPMKSVFEGQVLKVSGIDHDLLQVKGEKTVSMKKTGFIVVPRFGDTKKEHFLVLNYYKNQSVPKEAREGILKYRELSDLPIVESALVLSEVFAVRKPLSFREVFRNSQKYLMVTSNTGKEYDLLMEEGVLIRDGPGYKVFGCGSYIFRGEDIVYRFGGSA